MKKFLLLLFLIGSLLLVGCTKINPKITPLTNKGVNTLNLQEIKIHTIDPREVDEFLKRENIGIIDSRTKEEFNEGTLDNRAILIEIKKGDELEGSLKIFKREVNKLDKEKVWFIYCGSGLRSDRGAVIMIENGFKNIYELKGGLQEYESKK